MSPQEPSGAGPGPVEDADAYDRRRRRVLWALPTGLYLVGSHAEVDGVDRWNLMTANLVVQVATEPKAVAVAVDAGAVTAGLVEAGGTFTVSLLRRDDRTVVRRFVKPVTELDLGDDGRPVAMAGQAVGLAPGGAPVLAAAPAWLDCSVRQRLDLGSHLLFVGEVSAVGGDVDGVEVLRMEDTRMNYGG